MSKTFEEAMRQESSYREAEYAAVEKKDYQAADFFHAMRWRCMDAAIKVINVCER